LFHHPFLYFFFIIDYFLFSLSTYKPKKRAAISTSTSTINHPTPTISRTAADENLLGALGIPELNRLIGDGLS